MRTLERNKRKIYICKKYEEHGLIKYKPPIEVWDNYMPTNSDMDLVGIGLTYPMYLRIESDIANKDIYSAGDRVYVYTEPVENDSLAKNCDYIVSDTPLPSINQIQVTLKRLSDSNE